MRGMRAYSQPFAAARTNSSFVLLTFTPALYTRDSVAILTAVMFPLCAAFHSFLESALPMQTASLAKGRDQWVAWPAADTSVLIPSADALLTKDVGP